MAQPAMMEITVPEGMIGGQTMLYQFKLHGQNTVFSVFIPLGLKTGQTFSIPDPSHSVTVLSETASIYSVSCGSSAFCGMYMK